MNSMTHIFWEEGLRYAKYPTSNSTLVGHRKFRSFYGTSPQICAELWDLMENKPWNSEPKHLLWTLFFLKTYNTEHVNASIMRADEKTFRFWCWVFIDMLSNLNVVKWKNRLKNTRFSSMFVTLDGTDFRIREPIPFDKKWFSHKFHGAGVRYEVGISIGTGDVVWASGGFPCGEWPDIKIAKELYVYYAKKELTLADKGYKDKQFFRTPTNRFEKILLAKHETFNGRLKDFQILNHKFRHPLKKHPSVFHACVNILQLAIQNGETLFEI